MALALVSAFVAGFLARLVRLPALVGFLIAGFALQAFGFEPDASLDLVADLGILILLFGIGLKLRPRTLGRRLVWVTETAFAATGTIVVAGALLVLGMVGVPLAEDLGVGGAVVVGFGLSFSSTVFAVQALDQNREAGSLQGRLAISILVLQDLLAVGFIAVADGAWPSPWAVPVVAGFVLARWPLGWILNRTGHGEILVLLGFALAAGAGAGSFAAVGLKPDLGALAAGLVLSSHPRSGELADRLISFKDLLLVGFFLSIGLGGVPEPAAWIIGGVAVALMPIRSFVLYFFFTRLGLRSRTAFHASITLSTYSEFGLIVTASAVGAGMLGDEWGSTIAIAVAVSFAVTSAANAGRYRLFAAVQDKLQPFERDTPVPDDAILDFSEARIIVFGMGRVGTGAYERFEERLGPVVIGIDRSDSVVEHQTSLGRRVIRGDALDRDFWERVRFHPDVELVVAAMSSHEANLECVGRVREFLPTARTAAIAVHPDQVAELHDVGVDVARNLYEEAGQALADDSTDAVWGT